MPSPRHLIAALALAAALPAAHAQQGVNLTAGPVDYTTWTLLGSAQASNFTPGNGFTYSVLDLTLPGSGDQAGAAFAPAPLALDFNQAFRFDFNWYIQGAPSDLRGDGLTFTLTTMPAVGGGGSDLGYAGQHGTSVALAIDTFHFENEPVSPSLQILAAGSNTPLTVFETGLGNSIREAQYQWFGSLAYTPSGQDDDTGLLVGEITNLDLGSFSVETPINFGALGLGLAGQPVYYGFTASNGAAMDGHATSWGAAVPVPEPQTWLMLLAGLAAVGWMGHRRQRA